MRSQIYGRQESSSIKCQQANYPSEESHFLRSSEISWWESTSNFKTLGLRVMRSLNRCSKRMQSYEPHVTCSSSIFSRRSLIGSRQQNLNLKLQNRNPKLKMRILSLVTGVTTSKQREKSCWKHLLRMKVRSSSQTLMNFRTQWCILKLIVIRRI